MQITLFAKKQVYIDATDAFKQLKVQKFRRGIIFGCYCVSFVIVVFRCDTCVGALHSTGLHAHLMLPGWDQDSVINPCDFAVHPCTAARFLSVRPHILLRWWAAFLQ